MAETINTNQFKNGMHIEIDGGVWRIVDFQHVKPGKGSAFVRTKVKNLDSGAVVDRTFRAGEKFQRMHTEVKSAQYLYDSGDDVVFMEDDTYEQFSLPRTSLADELASIPPSTQVQVLTVDGKPSGLQLPSSIELTVAETEPGVKGDTVSNVTKSATLETGAIVQVPLFVNMGDRVKVDPREALYHPRLGGALPSRVPRSSTRRFACSARSRWPGGCRPPTCSGSPSSSTAPGSRTSRCPAAASSTRPCAAASRARGSEFVRSKARTKTPLGMALRGRFLVGSRPWAVTSRADSSRARPRAGSTSSGLRIR